MNLSDLIRDAGQILLFRYRPAESYRYGGAVFLFVALAIAVSHAASMVSIFGQNTAIAAFAAVIGIGRWLILTHSMRAMLHYFGAPHLPFLGYTLATEALILPNLLPLYFPETMSFISMWNIWIFWAQAFGFARMGGNRRGVILGYLVYWLGSGVFTAMMLLLFSVAGWLEPQSLLDALKAYWTNPPK
ncbi:MAG: hypothetical protein Q4B82_06465 [Alysiella sp.]|uniref:hypothetical protein n=1 Tax=Alysiella sp. TaxID=1872483 RepID=UPI0026DD5264|nr:hypothetical protein [Alysiella sp.]MDO4434205.1 hypothetical protein [Alysiella sp.]